MISNGTPVQSQLFLVQSNTPATARINTIADTITLHQDLRKDVTKIHEPGQTQMISKVLLLRCAAVAMAYFIPDTYNTDKVVHVGTVMTVLDYAFHSTNVHIPPVSPSKRPVITIGMTGPKQDSTIFTWEIQCNQHTIYKGFQTSIR